MADASHCSHVSHFQHHDQEWSDDPDQYDDPVGAGVTVTLYRTSRCVSCGEETREKIDVTDANGFDLVRLDNDLARRNINHALEKLVASVEDQDFRFSIALLLESEMDFRDYIRGVNKLVRRLVLSGKVPIFVLDEILVHSLRS